MAASVSDLFHVHRQDGPLGYCVLSRYHVWVPLYSIGMSNQKCLCKTRFRDKRLQNVILPCQIQRAPEMLIYNAITKVSNIILNLKTFPYIVCSLNRMLIVHLITEKYEDFLHMISICSWKSSHIVFKKHPCLLAKLACCQQKLQVLIFPTDTGSYVTISRLTRKVC